MCKRGFCPNWPQRRADALMQIENFDQTDAGGVGCAFDDGGVPAGIERKDNSAFERVGGRDPGGLNLRGLQRILLPVVVRCDQGPLAIVHFESWIGQGPGYTERGEGRTDRTNNYIS